MSEILLPNNQKLQVPCEPGQVSDGYHTFDELYEHRCLLMVGLMRAHPQLSWRANNHSDGTNIEGWFIAGMKLPTGQISYHLPVRMWELLDGCGMRTTLRAPEWDGHTSQMVIERLTEWFDWLRGSSLDLGSAEGQWR